MRIAIRALTAAAVALSAGAGGTAAAAHGLPSAGRAGLIDVVSTSAAMTQSGNWSGYNQGRLEKGVFFHEISATWIVPTATQHQAGQAEYSSTWVGIGGGCVNVKCTVGDSTLIQAGTEQDVSSSGQASYSAWWELIPAPSVRVNLPVSAGQRVFVDVDQTLPGVWKITIANRSTGQSVSKTLPYSSSYLTAEFIEETPLIIGGGGTGLSAMPNLSTVVFDPGTVNNGPPDLTSAEAVQLVDGSGRVLATPSAPDSERDGFADCTYATSCPVNAS